MVHQKINNVKETTMVSLQYVNTFKLDETARERIKLLIKKNKTSQRKIAKESEGAISYGYLAAILSGKKDVISKEKFMEICDLVGTSPELILDKSIKFFGN